MKVAGILFAFLLVLSTKAFAQHTLPYGLEWGMTNIEAQAHLKHYGYAVQDETLDSGARILRVWRNTMNFDSLSVLAIIVYFDETQRIASVNTYFPPVDSKTQWDAIRAISHLVQRDATGVIVRNQISSVADDKDLNGTILFAITGGAKYITVSSHSVGSDYSACVSFTDINYLKNKAKKSDKIQDNRDHW